MLTNEILDANTELASLTSEQKAAIVTLSKNDEDSVIAQKVGEIYGGLDADILAVSGVAKEGTEKTYAYAKRVISALKENANGTTELQNQVNALTKDKEKLQKALAEGSADAETKKQLKQAQADLANITAQYNELNTKYTESETKHQKALFGMQIDNELASVKGGLKFKSNLPESAIKVLYSQAETSIKSLQTEMIDDGNGGKVIAFKNADGSIQRNPNNKLLPFTAGELLVKSLNDMGVLDDGKPKTGAGTDTQNPKGNGAMNLTGAKTQREAMELIHQSLMAQGLTNGSKKYDDELQKMWKENEVSKLPM